MMKTRSLLWLWKLTAGIRTKLFVNCFLGIIRISASLAFIYTSKLLIDAATSSDIQQGPSIASLSVFLIILFIIQICSGLATSWYSNQNEVKTKNMIRHRLFEHLLRAKWSGMEVFHSGDILNRLEEDVRLIADTLSRTLPEIAVACFNLLAAFIFLWQLNHSLAWAIIAIMPAFLLISKVYIYKVRTLTHDIRETDSQVQSVIQESIQHRLLIQTMQQSDLIGDKLSGLQDILYNQTLRRTRFTVFSRAMVTCGFAAGYLFTFLWSIQQLHLGLITYGTMAAFLQLVTQIQRPTVELTRLLPSIIHATTSADRLLQLSDIPLENDLEGGVILEGPVGIQLSNVSYKYPQGERAIFQHFSYHFNPGSRTAIVGETGVGKSTLFRLILALLTPDQGDIILQSKDKDYPMSPSLRGNIAYVPQGNTLLSGTIRQNLLLANPLATEEELRHALYTASAEFVYKLPNGLDTICGEKSEGLSEGQAQRIAIARGLLRPGNIMLFDEFSASLDLETEKVLITRLLENYPQKTMIFITHRDHILKYCSDVIRLSF